MQTQPILEAQNLEKHFSSGDKTPVILQGISLKLSGGEVLGILGPNHSGKSLLLSILAGKVKPSAGSVAAPSREGYTVGLMPEQSIFPSVFTVKDIFSYHQQFYPSKLVAERAKGPAGQDIESWLNTTPLAGTWRSRVTKLDSSAQRWLSFYLACYGEPNVVLLDEPFQCFDEQAIERLGREISRLRDRGIAVAVASHTVGRLKEVSDELVIMHQGKIIHRAKKLLPDQKRYFCLQISGVDQESFDSLGQNLPPWQGLIFEGFLAKVFYSSYADCYQMMEKALSFGLVVVKFDTTEKPHLDDHKLIPHLSAQRV